MAFSAIFGDSDRRRDAVDQERLIELFSNRVELKKEFARLRAERTEMQDSLQRAETDKQALSRRLEYLEGLLTDGNTAVSTMLFYHLRGLWRRCAKRLESLSAEMSRRISGRRQVMMIETWQREREAKLAEVEQQLVTEKAKIESLKQHIREANEALQDCDKLWHFFRRRQLTEQREQQSAELKQQLINHNGSIELRRQLKNSRAPINEALEVVDKRTINLHVLALAQFLYAHFEEYGLVARSAAAISKDLGSVEYGDDEACREIMAQSDNAFRALLELERAPEFKAHLLRQAEHLQKFASYGSEKSAVPEPFDMIDNLIADPPSLMVSEYFAPPGSVTGGDIWSVSRAFML